MSAPGTEYRGTRVTATWVLNQGRSYGGGGGGGPGVPVTPPWWAFF